MIAHTLGNKGTVYADRGDWQQALDQFSKCLPLCQAASERMAEIQALAGGRRPAPR